MPKRKIAVVTGTRAEYGLLQGIMEELKNETHLELQVIVTGMHLSPEFGLTYQQIENDGFNIDAKVEMLLSSDTAVGITKSIGLGVIGFADALDRLKPDMLIVLGDRYEILAVVQSALIAQIPVAHIAGGDTTEGAYDESIRHSISKMSHLHFVTNKIAAQRVKQLGENPDHIFFVGSPGIDQIKKLSLLQRDEIAQELDFHFKPKNLLITVHPETLALLPTDQLINRILEAIKNLGPEIGLIFTKPNSDTNGRVIIHAIDEYVKQHPNAKSYTSLGQLRYFSTINQVNAVVGNSSSGLYEVPSFKKPTVNIGDRQKGRLSAASIINCKSEVKAIEQAMLQAFEMDCSTVSNPYGEGNVSSKIIHHLKQIQDPQQLIVKHFYS